MKYQTPAIGVSYFQPLPTKGNAATKVTFVTALSHAESDCLTFYSGDDLDKLVAIKAGIVIAQEQFKGLDQDFQSDAIVFAPHPKYTFIKALEHFCSDLFTDDRIRLEGPNISKHSYIESGAGLGEAVEVFPNTTIYDCVQIGDGSVIQSGSVIGANGLGDVFYEGAYHRFVHLGGVKVADQVAIGSNCTILRGMLEDTIIGEGTRIGNNVNIGHSSIIGKNVYISSGVTIGGACIIEDNCWISPGVTTTDHITIGKGTKIGTGSVVIKDALEDSFYLGNPARKLPSKP